jgi:hypothetical protein
MTERKIHVRPWHQESEWTLCMARVHSAHALCRSYELPLRDKDGQRWDFVVKSWANGTEHRRVYVLEKAAEYLAHARLREGDAIGICADVQGALLVEVVCLQLLKCASVTDLQSIYPMRSCAKGNVIGICAHVHRALLIRVLTIWRVPFYCTAFGEDPRQRSGYAFCCGDLLLPNARVANTQTSTPP